MSEGIFFVLGFGALILLVEGIQSNRKIGLMIMAGILAGLSYLARYTGLAFVGVTILIPMLFLPGSFWKRLRTMLPAGVSGERYSSKFDGLYSKFLGGCDRMDSFYYARKSHPAGGMEIWAGYVACVTGAVYRVAVLP